MKTLWKYRPALSVMWHILAVMCTCSRTKYVIRNAFYHFCRNCLWTRLSEFIKVCCVMTALSRCLTSKCSRKERKAEEVSVPWAGPLSPGTALCSFGVVVALRIPSVQGSTDCSKSLCLLTVCMSEICLSLNWDLSPPLNVFSVFLLN